MKLENENYKITFRTQIKVLLNTDTVMLFIYK